MSASNQSLGFIRKQPIIGLYFEFENELEFYKLEARGHTDQIKGQS